MKIRQLNYPYGELLSIVVISFRPVTFRSPRPLGISPDFSRVTTILMEKDILGNLNKMTKVIY